MGNGFMERKEGRRPWGVLKPGGHLEEPAPAKEAEQRRPVM